jgi:hypothetical protein
MVADRAWIKLNDELVVDGVALENHWEPNKPIYPTGQIELQSFANKLYFKNIYIKELNAGSDPFQVGSVWLDDSGWMKLTVLTRASDRFTARFFEDGFVREVAGTIVDNKVQWLAKDVNATSGGPGGDTFGTISSGTEGARIAFNRQDRSGTGDGTFSLRLERLPLPNETPSGADKPAAADSTAPKGFTALFNGNDLSGWKGDLAYWRVEEGAITGQTTADKPLKYNTVLVWNGDEPSDFELRLKYRITGGNSGIQYRSKLIDADKFIASGYQADIDADLRFTGMNYEERGRTFLTQRGERAEIGEDGKKKVTKLGDRDELGKSIKKDDWNEYVIVAEGSRLRHVINGVLMSEAIDNQKDKAAQSGVIALQLHRGPPMKVQFKDIELKRLQ